MTQLQRKRAELEDRANEAEGGLVAAQAGMEASGKRLEAELATVRSETRRTVEEAQLQHSREVCSQPAWQLLFDARYSLARTWQLASSWTSMLGRLTECTPGESVYLTLHSQVGHAKLRHGIAAGKSGAQ